MVGSFRVYQSKAAVFNIVIVHKSAEAHQRKYLSWLYAHILAQIMPKLARIRGH